MRRITLAALGALALLATTTTLRAQPAPEAPQFAARLSPAELKIETALARPIKLSFHEQPLKDVVADLGKQVDLPIELDPEGLEEADVTADQAISSELAGLNLRQVLEVLLGPLHLDYIPYNEGLAITSFEKCCEQSITRIYPVLDLIRVETGDDRELALDFDSLIDTCYSHVSPDTWTDNGGRGQIQGGPGGVLVVSQAYWLHRQIDSLLTGLRQLKSDHAKLKAGEVGRTIDLSGGQPIRAALAKRDTTTLDIELKFYVQDVAKVINSPILIDPEGLEEANVTPDQMVHAAYRDARIGDVFRRTLSKLHLNYAVRDGHVQVTSIEKGAEKTHTRIYPVGDLAPLRSIQEPPIRDLDTLIDMITDASEDPGGWSDHGGMYSISGWQEPAALLITATDEVHDDVEQLLAKLRETDIAAFNAEQAKADQRIVERIYPLYVARRQQPAKATEKETDKSEKKPQAETPSDNAKIPMADDVAKLIEEMLPEVSFKEKGTLLRPFHDRLIVRHRPAMLHKIEKLLEKIDAWPPGQGTPGLGGGGFFKLQPAAPARDGH